MLDDAQEDEQESIHEDAHEYLGALERSLLDELEQKEDGSSDTDYDEQLYTKMKTFWQLFSGGGTTYTITCTSCTMTSPTVDPFDALLLYFPERHHVSDQDCTLEDLLAYHCETGIVEEYECEICNKRTTGTKKAAITNCPPILCVVLIRKKQNGESIKSSVNFPVSGFSITDNDLQYNLVGTVHHKSDGPEHGHYTSICQAQRLPVWYYYDDEKVSPIQFVNKQQKERVLKKYTRLATILFYDLQTRDGREDLIELESDNSNSTESRFSS
jgi:ubiquitin C-terminal hydrolase